MVLLFVPYIPPILTASRFLGICFCFFFPFFQEICRGTPRMISSTRPSPSTGKSPTFVSSPTHRSCLISTRLVVSYTVHWEPIILMRSLLLSVHVSFSLVGPWDSFFFSFYLGRSGLGSSFLHSLFPPPLLRRLCYVHFRSSLRHLYISTSLSRLSRQILLPPRLAIGFG